MPDLPTCYSNVAFPQRQRPPRFDVGSAIKELTQTPGYEAEPPPPGAAEIDVALAAAAAEKAETSTRLDSKEGVKAYFVRIMRSKASKPADKVRAATELGKIVGAYTFDTTADLKKLSNDELAALILDVIPPVLEQIEASLATARRKHHAAG